MFSQDYYDVSDMDIPTCDQYLETNGVTGAFRIETYERDLEVEPTEDGRPARYLAVLHDQSRMLIAYIPVPVEKTGEAINSMHELLMVWHNSMLDMRNRMNSAWEDFHEREIAVAGVMPRD